MFSIYSRLNETCYTKKRLCGPCIDTRDAKIAYPVRRKAAAVEEVAPSFIAATEPILDSSVSVEESAFDPFGSLSVSVCGCNFCCTIPEQKGNHEKTSEEAAIKMDVVFDVEASNTSEINSCLYAVNLQITDQDALGTFVTFSNYNKWMISISYGRHPVFSDYPQIVQSLNDLVPTDSVVRVASKEPVDCVIMETGSDTFIFWKTKPVVLEWLSLQEYVKLDRQGNFAVNLTGVGTEHSPLITTECTVVDIEKGDTASDEFTQFEIDQDGTTEDIYPVDVTNHGSTQENVPVKDSELTLGLDQILASRIICETDLINRLEGIEKFPMLQNKVITSIGGQNEELTCYFFKDPSNSDTTSGAYVSTRLVGRDCI
jgi:hypothetical protein